ncbi:MFS transporter [Streptomyces endophyticus]|uniref:MFS transporter n=1 Tax=Streptomyces endophyticus TaxID=714166 RepID=A0ABU6F0E9_9ACTN|nr:MFS transporter [Streptomyces endophyticus]MEB8336930.1 MFS transporter [Streptomyces endophyticus]
MEGQPRNFPAASADTPSGWLVFFPVLVDGIGASGTFFLFAGICLAALVFAAALVPETRGRSLEDLGQTGTRAPR